MDEYISREKAIELIQPRVKPSTVYGEGYLQAIEHASEILALMPAADVQPAPKHTENMSTIAFCDRFICKNCDIHLENWVKVVIDPDDGDELHYEYEFKFCPECGARIVEVEV